MLISMCVTNYVLIMQYYDEYVPDNFSRNKILDKKYRCIRYFHNNIQNRYGESICKAYYYDYVAFNLEKSRYIFMYYVHNIIVITLFAIFHLVM